MDEGIGFFPPSVLQHISFSEATLWVQSSDPQCIIQIVKPSMVITILMAVFKEYEEYLTINRVFFMERVWRDTRLQLSEILLRPDTLFFPSFVE